MAGQGAWQNARRKWLATSDAALTLHNGGAAITIHICDIIDSDFGPPCVMCGDSRADIQKVLRFIDTKKLWGLINDTLRGSSHIRETYPWWTSAGNAVMLTIVDRKRPQCRLVTNSFNALPVGLDDVLLRILVASVVGRCVWDVISVNSLQLIADEKWGPGSIIFAVKELGYLSLVCRRFHGVLMDLIASIKASCIRYTPNVFEYVPILKVTHKNLCRQVNCKPQVDSYTSVCTPIQCNVTRIGGETRYESDNINVASNLFRTYGTVTKLGDIMSLEFTESSFTTKYKAIFKNGKYITYIREYRVETHTYEDKNLKYTVRYNDKQLVNYYCEKPGVSIILEDGVLEYHLNGEIRYKVSKNGFHSWYKGGKTEITLNSGILSYYTPDGFLALHADMNLSAVKSVTLYCDAMASLMPFSSDDMLHTWWRCHKC